VGTDETHTKRGLRVALTLGLVSFLTFTEITGRAGGGPSGPGGPGGPSGTSLTELPTTCWEWIITVVVAGLPSVPELISTGPAVHHKNCVESSRELGSYRSVNRFFRNTVDRLTRKYPYTYRIVAPVAFGLNGNVKVILDKGIPYAVQELFCVLTFVRSITTTPVLQSGIVSLMLHKLYNTDSGGFGGPELWQRLLDRHVNFTNEKVHGMGEAYVNIAQGIYYNVVKSVDTVRTLVEMAPPEGPAAPPEGQGLIEAVLAAPDSDKYATLFNVDPYRPEDHAVCVKRYEEYRDTVWSQAAPAKKQKYAHPLIAAICSGIILWKQARDIYTADTHDSHGSHAPEAEPGAEPAAAPGAARGPSHGLVAITLHEHQKDMQNIMTKWNAEWTSAREKFSKGVSSPPPTFWEAAVLLIGHTPFCYNKFGAGQMIPASGNSIDDRKWIDRPIPQPMAIDILRPFQSRAEPELIYALAIVFGITPFTTDHSRLGLGANRQTFKKTFEIPQRFNPAEVVEEMERTFTGYETRPFKRIQELYEPFNIKWAVNPAASYSDLQLNVMLGMCV